MPINLANILNNIGPAITGISPANGKPAKKKDGDEDTTETGKNKDPKNELALKDTAGEAVAENSRLKNVLQGNQAAPQQPAVMPPPQGAFGVPGQGASSGGGGSSGGKGSSGKGSGGSSGGSSGSGCSSCGTSAGSADWTGNTAAVDVSKVDGYDPQASYGNNTIKSSLDGEDPKARSKANPEKTISVTFSMTGCGPCLGLEGQMQGAKALPAKFDSSKVEMYQLKDQFDVADSYGVKSYPTTIIFKNGEELARVRGNDPGSIENGIAATLPLKEDSKAPEGTAAQPAPQPTEPIEHAASQGPDLQDDSNDEASPFQELKLN
ncbi:MAG: thioredoxin family protein [Candidatus Melainabacteria bacterium]|nr:thioredoxin family protein [Candidatus Melainabacteria bacterium]